MHYLFPEQYFSLTLHFSFTLHDMVNDFLAMVEVSDFYINFL